MRKVSSEIKHRAKVLGIVYSDKVYCNTTPFRIVRLLCKTLDKLELRDADSYERQVPEVAIFIDNEVAVYAYLVKKSRRKPRQERGNKR